MADVADLRVKYSADTRDFDAGADRVNKGIKGFIQNAGAFAAGDLLAGGIRAIGSAATGAIGALAGMAMESANLDAQISGIVALAGGGAEDFDKLSEAIDTLAINPNLIVDSEQAATVMQNLIANGLTLQQTMGGAAEATVLLANATGGSFETAATVATDTMAIFGIEAENMMAAVDGISRVSNASKFDIEDYAYALSQGGAQSASAGVEFEDFNAILVASASNFSGGSDAGTGIRNMFQKLIPTTVDATTAMYQAGLLSTDYAAAAERLGDILGYEVAPNQNDVITAFKRMSAAQGININDTKKMNKVWDAFADDFEVSAFYDAEGSLKSAAEIAGAFNTAFKDMNEQDKATAINEMFGPDAARAVLAMADYSEEAFQTLIDGMNGTASAAENARTRTDNLKGDMDAFASIVDSTGKKIGKEFEPALRTLFQSGSGLLNDLRPAIIGIADSLANGLERATPSIIGAIEGIVTAASIVAQEGFGGFFKVFEDGSTIAGSLAVALGASEEVVNSFTNMMVVAARDGFSALFTVFEDGSTVLGSFAGAIGLNGAAIDSFIAKISGLKTAFDEGGFKGLFDEAFADVDFIGMTTKIKESLQGIPQLISDQFNAANFESLKGKVVAALGLDKIDISLDGIKDKVVTAVSGITWDDVTLSFDTLKTSISTAFSTAFSGVDTADLLAKVQGWTTVQMAAVGAGIMAAFNSLTTFDPALLTAWATTQATNIGDMVAGAISSVEIDWTVVTAAVDSIFGKDGIVGKIGGTINTSLTTISTWLDAVDGESIGAKFSLAVSGILGVVGMVGLANVEGVGERISSLSGVATSVFDFLTSFATGIDVAAIATSLSTLATTFADGIEAAINDEALSNLGAAAGTFVSTLVGKIGELLSTPNFGEDLGEGVGKATSAIAQGASALVTSLATELGSVDWVQFKGNIETFAGGFASGVAGAVAKADWTPVASAMAVAIGGAIGKAIDAALPFGLAGNRLEAPPEVKQMLEANLKVTDIDMAGFDKGLPVSVKVEEEPEWGKWTNVYDVGGIVPTETDVEWGPHTNEYDVTGIVPTSSDIGWGSHTNPTPYSTTGIIPSANAISWGTWSTVYDVTARIANWIMGEPPPIANTSGAMFGLPGNTGTGYNAPATTSTGSIGPSYSSGNGGRGLGLPALAGAGGGGIVININGYNQDEESLARRIAAIIQRRS